MAKKIIFSGIQPTGNLHIGNYLGALKNWVVLQDSPEHECYFCIADYHSLTGAQSSKERKTQIVTLAAELLASGIDPLKSTFFIQSHVPEHTELAWIFNTLTPILELQRMTQFKDKARGQVKNINTGLFTYPILQAADILLYHGTHVPVGEDQVQHIELTRNIARWFNNKYKQYFPETKPLLTNTPRVRSLLDPEKKMSKSLGEGHVINLSDDPDIITQKIKRAVTATSGGGRALGVQNLLVMMNAFGDEKIYTQFLRAEKNSSISYAHLKESVANAISDYFAEFRARRAELLKDKDTLANLLDAGAARAREVAASTMKDVRKLVGIR